MATTFLYITLAFASLELAFSFYVPGVAPIDFSQGQKIEVKAIKMTSSHTQLPFEYYSLPFCEPPDGGIVYKTENLGEILRGDRISSTGKTLLKLKSKFKTLKNYLKIILSFK